MVDITLNKARFTNIIRKIDRGMTDEQKSNLITYLDNNGFFTSPASTKYHCSYEGGLCEHSLSVYDTLLKVVEAEGYSNVYDEECVAIVALLHDIDKMFMYTTEIRNKKIYTPNGSKSDNMGRFDWVSVEEYKYRDKEERFILGTHGQNCAYMVNGLVPLTMTEFSAILNHMGGMEKGSEPSEVLNDVYSSNPLAIMLHVADMLSTYVGEKNE